MMIHLMWKGRSFSDGSRCIEALCFWNWRQRMTHCKTDACGNVGMASLDHLRDGQPYCDDLYIDQRMGKGTST